VVADSGKYISIVDKAMLRKKELNEGLPEQSLRLGELNVDDLLAVALDDGQVLPPAAVEVLALACDIDTAALRSGAGPSTADSP
jgi:hypothetical protein